MCVAESAMEPPSSIPNLVVPHGSAGEYCTGNCVGGEAAAHTSQLLGLLESSFIRVATLKDGILSVAYKSNTTQHRGVEQRQLVGLITQRSRVRIPSPLPSSKTPGFF